MHMRRWEQTQNFNNSTFPPIKLVEMLELLSKSVIDWCIDIKTAPNLWYNKITIQTIQRRGADLMINKMSQNENTQNQFSNVIRELQKYS